MMKSTLLLLMILFSAGVLFAQKQKPAESQRLNAVLDSARNVFKKDVQHYQSKVDSINKAQYQIQLERAIGITNTTDTKYGTFFTILGVVIALLTFYIAVDFLVSSRAARRRLRELSQASGKALEEQRIEFQEVLDDQCQRFDALEEQAKDFQEAYQKNLQDQIASFEDRMTALRGEGNVTEGRYEELKEELRRIKESKTITDNGVPDVICKHCGTTIPKDQKRFYKKDPKVNGLKKMVICPFCGRANTIATARLTIKE